VHHHLIGPFWGALLDSGLGVGHVAVHCSLGRVVRRSHLGRTGVIRTFSHLRPRSSEEHLPFLRVRGAPARRRYRFTGKNGARARGGARSSLI
jgi:hypothetical protein